MCRGEQPGKGGRGPRFLNRSKRGWREKEYHSAPQTNAPSPPRKAKNWKGKVDAVERTGKGNTAKRFWLLPSRLQTCKIEPALVEPQFR